MHVLITGINGYISQYLLRYKPSNITVSGTYHSTPNTAHSDLIQIPLELGQSIFNQLDTIDADVVIHTAAYSNLALCENNPDLAYRINGKATEELADWCKQTNTHLVYLSTDIVFDGDSAPYSETDTPKSINVYGKSKYQGECAVKIVERNTIIRLALVLGQGIGVNKNFVDWIIDRIKTKQNVPLFFDEIRTPVCAGDVAKAIWNIVEQKTSGVLHICSSQSIDRYTLGDKICNYYDSSFKNIQKKSLKDQKVKRPRDVSLLNNKLEFKIPSILTHIGDLFL